MDKIGRKYALLTMTIPQVLSFICIGLARSIYTFYVARVFSGLAEAGVYTALPTFAGEIATPKVRGSWGNTLASFMYAGHLVTNTIGGFASVANTAWVCVSFPVIFVACFVFIPETPYYYLMKGRKDAARKSLQWYRRIENVDKELDEIEEGVKKQMTEAGTWRELFVIKSNRRALAAGVFLRVAQQTSGIACFAMYTNLIFQKAGGNISTHLSSIIFTAATTTAMLIASFTLDKFGRRRSVISSLIACSLILTSVAIFLYVSLQRPEIDVSAMNWFPLVGMLLYVPAFGIGLGTVPTLMLGELFAANIKAKGLCILNVAFGVIVGGTTKMFQILLETCGLYMPFAVFAGWCACNSLIGYVVIPETKGKTLDQIQQALKGGKKEMFK